MDFRERLHEHVLVDFLRILLLPNHSDDEAEHRRSVVGEQPLLGGGPAFA